MNTEHELFGELHEQEESGLFGSEHRRKNETPASCQTAISCWVACSEKLPTVELNGQKVLVYRIMNDSQASMATSIYETSMVKYCNVNETWWMELPEPPCL